MPSIIIGEAKKANDLGVDVLPLDYPSGGFQLGFAGDQMATIG